MDIEEIKTLKIRMEQSIEDLILLFEKETGLLIDRLDLTQDFGQIHGRILPNRMDRPFIRTKVML